MGIECCLPKTVFCCLALKQGARTIGYSTLAATVACLFAQLATSVLVAVDEERPRKNLFNNDT